MGEPADGRRPESISGPSSPPPRGEASQLHTTYVLLSAACRGNAHARTLLEARLVRSAQLTHLVVLSDRLRKIIDGERDPDALSRNLSDVDRIIVTGALEALDDTSGREPMPVLEPLMEGIVAAARYGRDRTGRSPDHHLMLWTFAELDEMGAQDDDAALFDAQVRRLFAGDDQLDWNGLGDTFTAVLWVILDRLAQPT